MPAPGIPAAALTKTSHSDIYPAISPLHALKDSAKGLSVFITGAGRGFGRAEAIVFAQAGAAKIVLVSRTESELTEVVDAIKAAVPNNPPVIITCKADVSNEEDIAQAFEKAGEVNVLINNAGTGGFGKRIHESSVQDWWKTWEINMKGTYVPAREAIKRTLASGKAPVNLTIINTSSIGSALTTLTGSSYQTTKSAVNRFTEFLHFEYESEGIRTFSVHPGGSPTKLALDTLPAILIPQLVDTLEIAAGYFLWLATQGEKVDFLRGRYSSANWDVDELVEQRDRIVNEDLLWTRVAGYTQSSPK